MMTPYTYTKLTCENSLKTATAPRIGWGCWGWLFSPPFSKMALLQLHQQLHPPLADGAWVVNFKGILPSCHVSHKKGGIIQGLRSPKLIHRGHSIHTNPYNALLRSIQDKSFKYITIHLLRGVLDLSPFDKRIKVVDPNSLCEVKIVLGHPPFLAHFALCLIEQSPDSRSSIK